MKRLIIISILLSFSCFAENKTELMPESKQLLQQLEQEIDNTLLTISKIEANGENAKNIHLTLNKPMKKIFDLGLVIDTDEPNKGLKVISVSPNSIASEQGIDVNSYIVKVNEVLVSAETISQALSQLTNVKDSEQLTLSLSYENKLRDISIIVKGNYVPPYSLVIGSELPELSKSSPIKENGKSACGRVSLFSNPPETRYLFRVSIHSIDSEAKIIGNEYFALPVGKHIIYLNDRIDSRYRSTRGRSMSKAKGIEIDIKANITYHLAAKFNPRKKFKTSSGEYWEPVIWKTSERDCEL